jgi:hypothetical protein
VAKILGTRGPSGDITTKVYLAQDGPKVRAIMTDLEHTKNFQSMTFTMDLSKMTETEFPAPHNIKFPGFSYERPGYNIKKSDGTGVLTPS